MLGGKPGVVPYLPPMPRVLSADEIAKRAETEARINAEMLNCKCECFERGECVVCGKPRPKRSRAVR